MSIPKLTRLELQIMDALWGKGPCSIREIQEHFPEALRPAYTTVRTSHEEEIHNEETVFTDTCCSSLPVLYGCCES